MTFQYGQTQKKKKKKGSAFFALRSGPATGRAAFGGPHWAKS
jgi:hypothetical protein